MRKLAKTIHIIILFFMPFVGSCELSERPITPTVYAEAQLISDQWVDLISQLNTIPTLDNYSVLTEDGAIGSRFEGNTAISIRIKFLSGVNLNVTKFFSTDRFIITSSYNMLNSRPTAEQACESMGELQELFERLDGTFSIITGPC